MNKKGIIIFLIVYTALCFFMSFVERQIEGKNLRITNEVQAKDKITQVENKKLIAKELEAKKEVIKPIVNRYGYKKESDEIKKQKQEIVNYLWEKTNNIDMILTFEYESGLDPKATYNNIRLDKNGKEYIKSTDFGLCMLNNKYHSNFIESKEFNNWKNQADYCIRVWNDGIKKGRINTTFYGYNNRMDRRSLYYINQEAYNIFWKK